MESPGERPEAGRAENGRERRLARTLLWVGIGLSISALGATLAYVLLRFTAAESGDDPTTQRIQELIDEANSLLKALDDQRHSA